MASWPSDTRQTQQHTAQNSKNKHNIRSHWEYPVLAGGAINSTSLRAENGHLYWTTIIADNGRRLRSNGGVRIHPRTRFDTLQPTTKSITRQTEASANFLRKVYPDIDISSELIRDELASDAQVLMNRQIFDPAIGNMLEAIYFDHNPQRFSTFLAYPMGENRSQLNISPFAYSRHDGLIFRPVTTPAFAFATPIQQIVLAKSSALSAKSDAVLAVRTMGSASLLSIRPDVDGELMSYSQVTEMSQILSSDIGGRPLMDIQVSHSPSNVSSLVLNDKGSLYEINHSQGSKNGHSKYINIGSTTSDKGDLSWKLAVNDDFSLCYITSNDVVRQLDLRTPGRTSEFWSLNNPDAVITSMEVPRPDNLMRLVTTKEILWLDERNPGKPVLGIKHGRDIDRTLGIYTTNVSTASLSFLLSKRTGFVSVYDVSRNRDALTHMHAPPYCLRPSTPHSELPLMGHTFLRHPSMNHISSISLFELSSHGSIHRLDTKLSSESGNGEQLQGQKEYFQWHDDVIRLHAIANQSNTDMGTLVEREHSDVDLKSAYEDFFINAPEDNKDGGAAYDLINKMPLFWQASDVPIDHVLTTFDIAFLSGDEPSETSRADFLAGSAMTNRRGFHAFKTGRLNAKAISKDAPWCQDLTRTFQIFVPDISEDIHVMLERLRSYNLPLDCDRNELALQRESLACDQLALDLGLSVNVYSGKPFLKHSGVDLEDAFETMSISAKSSLEEHPPPLTFGFLTPVLKSHDYYPRIDSDDRSQQEVTPLGVRLLLDEWSVGMDPSAYRYEDPYKDNVQTTPGRRKLARSPINPTAASSQSQRPPLVVGSNALARPPIVTTQSVMRPRVEDDLPRSSPLDMREPECSQHMMISTQTVPGPYGSRQLVNGKKMVKRRIGGF